MRYDAIMPTHTTCTARTFGLAILCLLPARLATSQAAQAPPPRFESTAQFTLLANTGNSEATSLGIGGDMTYRPNPWVYTAKTAFAQNEDKDGLSARFFGGLFRAARTINPRLAAYSQYDYLRDLFAGIEQRHTVEGGLSYLLVDSAPHRLRLDGAIGYQKEMRLARSDFDSPVAIVGPGYRWVISPTSAFADEARFTLAFADAGAWKFDNTASLTAALTSVFSLKVSNIIRYAHDPVPGFKQTDTITSVALVMTVTRPGP
jgi:putative salt-induced outer membrane protein